MAISEELAAAFIDADIIRDEPTVYGSTFIDAAGSHTMFLILDEFNAFFGIEGIRPEIWDALCACVLMGDGDCPECGGELRFVETEGHKLNDGDYYTPNSYVIDSYVYECANCGVITKSKNEL